MRDLEPIVEDVKTAHIYLERERINLERLLENNGAEKDILAMFRCVGRMANACYEFYEIYEESNRHD